MNTETNGQGPDLPRRAFIVGSVAAAGGGLALGLRLPFGHRCRHRIGRGEERGHRRSRGQCLGRHQARRYRRDPHRALGDGPGHAHRPRPARRRGARVRLAEGHDRLDHPRAEPRPQARLGRDGNGREPRHPHLPGLRPPRRRGGAHDAAASGGQPVAGAGERGHRGRRRDHARGLEAFDQLRQGRRRGGRPRGAGSEKHHAQGSERLEARRQAAEAAGHGAQAERQPGLRDRRRAAGHAARRDQGLPGVRRHARELRRGEDRGDARRTPRRQGQRHDGRGRRRYLVEGQAGARRAADRLGGGRRRLAVERDDRGASQGGPDGDGHERLPSERRRAQGDRGRRDERSRRSTARPSSPTRPWSR